MGDYLHRDARADDHAAISAHYLAQLQRAREMMDQWEHDTEENHR